MSRVREPIADEEVRRLAFLRDWSPQDEATCLALAPGACLWPLPGGR